MKKIFTIIVCCLSILLHAQTPDANGIVYVTTTGTGNGSSWNTSTNNLQGAINSGATKVFVAIGNYNAPASSFAMKDGVEIYGGFDPTNNIKTLNNNRILPNKGMGDGSVLNGQNARRVIANAGITVSSTAILDGFTIMNGYTVNNGAGIYNYSASPTLRNLVIRNNTSGTAGGGIYNNVSAAINLSNSVIKDNTAQYGGGMYNNSSASVLTNVSIAGNTATLDIPGAGGGGIFNQNANLQLTNVLIADNSTNFQGGGFRNLSGNPVLTNVTLVKNNASVNAAIDIAGGTLQINNSIVFGETAGSYTPQNSLVQFNAGGSNGNLDGMSIFPEDVFNNFSNGDYTLKNTSPVINKGNNALFAGLGGNSKDLVGNERAYNYANGGIIDMGAYESNFTPLAPNAGILYVRETAIGTEDGSSWENATSDLHNAIHMTGVQKVFVAIGNYNVGDNSFVMQNGVEIYGGFDPDNNIRTLNDARTLPSRGMGEGSILNGQNIRPVIWNVFTQATALDNTAVLDGFTIKNGNYPSGYGGGINNLYAAALFRNLLIENNNALFGGGISCRNSNAVFIDVVISNNQSYGASGGGGGALYNNDGSPILTNTAIINNIANYQAGGLYNDGGNPVFNNVIIAGNQHEGFMVFGGSLSFNNSIVFKSNFYDNYGNYTANYSLIEGNPGGSNGNLNGTSISVNDVFTNPSAGNYTLKMGSPAIDAGGNTLFPNLDVNSKDLAGDPRVNNFSTGGIIDLGVYESSFVDLAPDANGIIYVRDTATGDKTGSSWENATSDLHNAIHTIGVQKVFVAIGNYNVGDNSFVMQNGVEIYGGFDPDNNIRTLNDARTLPNRGMGDGSVLNGQNTRPVVWNDNNNLDSSAVLDGFTLTNGFIVDFGGGIYNVNVSPTFRNLVIRDNSASNWGGGIYNKSSSPNFVNVIIKNNHAFIGGGMYNAAGSYPVFTNALITGNTASFSSGGGIYNFSQTGGTFNNTTVVANSPDAVDDGGGIQWNNSIVYGTMFGNYSSQYSLIQGNSGGSNGNLNGTSISANDVFTNPSSGDYTLKMGSPAIDKGSNVLFPDLDENTKDIAGNARVFDFQHTGKIDLGAYESNFEAGIVYVKTVATGTGDGSSWANATADISGATNIPGVTRVYVASGVYYKKFVGTVAMKNGVEIYGGFNPVNDQTDWDTRYLPNQMTGNVGFPQGPSDFSHGSVISAADWGATGYTSQVIATSGLNNSAVLDGFTITGADGVSIQGGGIINNNSSPTLRNLWITSNMAMRGAGIYNMNSSPIVTNVIFNYNYTGYNNENNMSQGPGGAIFNGGNSSPVFTNVLIITNGSPRTPENGGGGVYHSGTGTATFINCTFDNNRAGVNTYNEVPNSVTIDANAMGTVSFLNSIVFGGVVGNYTAQNSLIEGNTDFTNGNLNPTGISQSDVFISTVSSTSPSLGNFGLKYNSPAINAGNNALFPDLDVNSTDIQGNHRVKNFNNTGLIIDLGAYESSYTPIIPTNGIVYVRPANYGNEDGSSWENATNDLHKAIQTTGVSKVFVAVGNYPVGDNSFIMKNNVEIYGGFDPDNNIRTLNDTRIYPSLTVEGSVLDGQNVRPVIWNVFDAATALDNTALLDGFTVKNGSYSGDGGGVRNVYASPVFNHVVIKNNKTTGYRNGGGIYNDHSHPQLLNTIVTGNSAYMGGGIFNENTSTVSCINYLSFGNSARATIQNRNGEIESVGLGSTFINATIVGETKSDVYLDVNDVLINSIIPNGMNSNLIAPQLAVFKNSLVLGAVTGGVNQNIDASGMVLTDIFTDPANGDFTLKNNSPAANTGDNSLFPNLDANSKDIANNSRVFDFINGGIIDMGAYESSSTNVYQPITPDVNGIVYVRTTAFGDETGSSWENATNRFQAAINTTTAQKVFVGSGIYNLTKEIYMRNNVAIYGGFDPDNGIRTLNDTRILLDTSSTTVGSVLKSNTLVAAVRNFENFLDSTAVLDGFTITNSGGYGGISNTDAAPTLQNLFITGNHSTANGGGIYNYSNSSPIISNVVISGNIGQNGAGIYNSTNSSPVLSNVIISGNSGQFGAGMYNNNNCNPILTEVVFKNNIAVKDGGGINNNNHSNPVITNVKFQNNQADYGGGVFNRNSSPTMTNIEITNNTANRDAGGMYNDANSSPVITNLKLTGNTANNANGGGMYNRNNSSPTLVNVLIAGNTAVNNGGAIRNESNSSPVLTNVTIAANNGSNTIYATDGNTTLNNSIIYGTISATYTAQYSLVEGNAGGTNGNLDGTILLENQIFTNAANDDYSLKSGSPAINMGSNALFPNLDENTKDLAGNPRVYDYLNAGAIDLGAYESGNLNSHICYKPALTPETDKYEGTNTGVGITSLNRETANADGWLNIRKSGWLLLESKTKAFVLNRLTEAQISTLTPVEGMLVYDTTNECLKVYTSTDGQNFGWYCMNEQSCPE